ncbi:MAG: hypothetical protein P1U53_03220 [Sulfitobacter sp.]|nr:hypothetical protein [Sulfitobacter sp.]
MPRRIILHTGFHKTGTTTIQNTLRENRDILMKHVALRLRWHMKDLVAATRGYSTWRDPLTLIKVQHRFHQMLEELPGMPRRTLIISCEELSGHLPGRGDLEDYSAAPELLYAFWEIAHEMFPQSEILCYFSTRAPGPWLRSAYWEHVKAASMTLDFDAFQARYAPAARLDEMVAEVASRLPVPVHSCALEDCKDRSLGPAEPLLDLLDLPLDVQVELRPTAPSNEALGNDVLEALLAVNRTEKDPAARDAKKAAILAERTAR